MPGSLDIQAIPDLLGALSSFGGRVQRRTIDLQTSQIIADRFLYTEHENNLNGNENHFQGIAVVDDGRALAVSGSNWKEPAGDLLAFSLEPEGSNPDPVHGIAKLGLDPIAFRAINDTQVDPEQPKRPFSQRQLSECFRIGAERFGYCEAHSFATPGDDSGSSCEAEIHCALPFGSTATRPRRTSSA